ncbi:MAG: hypothetical protein HYY25_01430 [Candidatus Wallbacteria bacterium]|nr:hypothetical protein [Candidatus Wallbacteria bacterium]
MSRRSGLHWGGFLILAIVASASVTAQPAGAGFDDLPAASLAAGRAAPAPPSEPQPPDFSGRHTRASAANDGLRLVLTSRFGSSSSYFWYEARVQRTEDGDGLDIESVEYVFPPVTRQPSVTVRDGAHDFKLVRREFGFYTLTAKVSVRSHYLFGRISTRQVISLSAAVPYPKPLPRAMPAGLQFRLEREATSTRSTRFTIRLAGDARQLEQVLEVEYVLHPTFARPMRAVSDRASGFAITDVCWGSFDAYAMLLFADGSRHRAHVRVAALEELTTR